MLPVRGTISRCIKTSASMPGKTYDQFLRSDQVQWEWWNAFKIDRPSITLLPDLSADAFKRTFYTPSVYEMTRERTHKFLAHVDEFDTGGSLEDEGDLAIRIAFVPLVAFAFSMADAYVPYLRNQLPRIPYRQSKEIPSIHCRTGSPRGNTLLLLSCGPNA